MTDTLEQPMMEAVPTAVLARKIPTAELAVELMERARTEGAELVGSGGFWLAARVAWRHIAWQISRPRGSPVAVQQAMALSARRQPVEWATVVAGSVRRVDFFPAPGGG